MSRRSMACSSRASVGRMSRKPRGTARPCGTSATGSPSVSQRAERPILGTRVPRTGEISPRHPMQGCVARGRRRTYAVEQGEDVGRRIHADEPEPCRQPRVRALRCAREGGGGAPRPQAPSLGVVHPLAHRDRPERAVRALRARPRTLALAWTVPRPRRGRAARVAHALQGRRLGSAGIALSQVRLLNSVRTVIAISAKAIDPADVTRSSLVLRVPDEVRVALEHQADELRTFTFEALVDDVWCPVEMRDARDSGMSKTKDKRGRVWRPEDQGEKTLIA